MQATARKLRENHKMTALQPLGQHAQADAIMPNQLHQPGAASPKGVDRAIKRIRAQALLDQHRQAHHAFAHVGHTQAM